MLDSKWWEDLLLPSLRSPKIRAIFFLLILGIMIPVVVAAFPYVRSHIIDIPMARILSLALIVVAIYTLISALSLHPGARWIISAGLVFIAACRVIFIAIQAEYITNHELVLVLPAAADLLGSAGSLMVTAGFGITVRQVLRARSLLLKQNEQLMLEIEQRTRAEAALRTSEEKYRTLIEFSADSIFMVDYDGTILYVNPIGEAVLLGNSHKTRPATLRDISEGEDDYAWRLKLLREVIETRAPRMVEDVFVREGRELFTLTTVQPLPEMPDTPRCALVVSRDISERKHNEAEIRRLAAAIDQAGEGILIADRNLEFVYANPAVERLTAYSGAGLIARYGNDPAVQPCSLALAAGRSWQGGFTLKRQSGDAVNLAASAYPVRGENGAMESYVVLLRDVTHESALERQLRQSQKMEAIGTLAGGVAHEFNNLLGAIMGHAELLLDELYEMEKYRESAQAIIGASERASEIVSQILAFSRPAEVRSEPLDIRLVVRETLRLLRASLPSTIEIRERIGTDLGVVRADLAVPGTRLEVEIFGTRHAAEVLPEGPVWDPTNARLRG